MVGGGGVSESLWMVEVVGGCKDKKSYTTFELYRHQIGKRYGLGVSLLARR